MINKCRSQSAKSIFSSSLDDRPFFAARLFILFILFYGSISFASEENKQATNKYGSKQTSANLSNKLQDLIVSGYVLDSENLPLVGVAVAEKGTKKVTVTNSEGYFSLKSQVGAILEFSFVGFKKSSFTVVNANEIKIKLQEDTQLMNEVVVIGYGTTTRKSVTGAIDQIKSSIIENRPVANTTQALQGVSPSLVIQQRSMNPNDNTLNINIRGVSTFNNTEPLVVIDGVIANSTGALNSLNPSDIESISVLKDAGSAAIYGSRSANGVLLVTTKKGSKNMTPRVSFSTSVGSQNPEVLLKPVVGYENAMLRNDAYVNSGLAPVYSSQQIQDFATHDSEYMMNAILKDGFQQTHNASVRGGSENTSYMVSAGYFDQRSNFRGPDYGTKRYNFRLNLTAEYKKFKLTTIAAYDRTEGKSFQGNTGFLLANSARVPVYNTYKPLPENGRYYANEILNSNPLADLEQGGFTKTDNDHFQGIVNGEYEIIKGLKAKAIFGLDLNPDHRLIRRFFVPIYDLSGSDTPINASTSNNYSIEDYNGKATYLNSQFLLDFNRTFNKDHNITALAGYSNESYRQQRNEIKKQFVDPELGVPIETTIIDVSSYNTPGGTTERALASVFGRLGYIYKDRYFAEVSMRYDGSSKFAKEERWGFFPSVSLGWRASEESFMKAYKERVGDLKIRGSYGTLGNQSADDYQTYTTYTVYNNQYGFNNVAGSGTGYTFGNPNLRWETSKTFNIGADAGFFKNKLNVSFDYFHKLTSGILLTPLVPGTLGGAVANANIGSMKNQGWDLSINYRLKHSDFNHTFGFNLGDSRNEVTEFEGFERIDKSDEIERITRVGLPYASYYGYKMDGYFRNQEEILSAAIPIGADLQPGDIRYVDRNGDGVINDSDRFVLGHAFPRFTFGFNYNFEWKGFDIGMLWQGVGKREMALRGESIEPFHGNYSFVIFQHQLDYWTPDNQEARYPRLTAPSTSSTTNNYGKGSDLQIFNAAYLRLKNIQIGYSLPKSLTQKIGAQKVRFFLNAQNMITLSHQSFIDPESSEFGSNMGAGGANSGRNYPLIKYFGGGLNVEF
ncbi:SusC/RagA family TonB-linked outer membrane protein [Pedobacter xixiisoli]|uniref:TonB-linked outer membrane protein, SusC/RagA family n=1 Tax=Pedobacter xixiisoli TaxID=1476464 RepID=A0A286A0C1_9SPHI|nr:TonB-dependent receptor [Pedobacter xixiisoli]SOD15346.1 TonB-linked outer membrane protein, SusC/RagA family [Pedobacter xixiisoli]